MGGIPVPKCDGITEVTMQIFYDLDAYKWINGLSQQEIWVMQMCGTSRCIEPTVPAAKDESFWRKKCPSLPACVSGCVVFVEKCHIQTKILGTVSLKFLEKKVSHSANVCDIKRVRPSV